MTALSADRNTPSRDGREFTRKVAAGKKIFIGALVVLNAAKFAQPATTATGLIADGRAEGFADNSAGADGDILVRVRQGAFYYANSAADPIAQADIGNTCYIVDDQTVAKTNGSATRSAAGTILDVDSALGVLVGVGILHP